MLNFADFENPLDAFFALGAAPRRRPPADIAEFVVFDTESSALGSSAVAVQVCVGMYDASGKALAYYDRLWKLPRGATVSAGSLRIHGITRQRIEREGLDAVHELRKVQRIFSKIIARGKRIVAHNAAFDVRILRQTARAHGFDGWDLHEKQTFCTMRASAPICNLKSRTGRPRKPRNAELYRLLVGKPPVGALHDARVDCDITARSFAEGKKRGWWGFYS